MGNQNGKSAGVDSDRESSNTSSCLVNGKEVVKKKLLSSPIYRAHFESDDELLDTFSHVLSNVDELKQKYLNLDWMETVELHKQLEKQVSKAEVELQRKRNIAAALAEARKQQSHMWTSHATESSVDVNSTGSNSESIRFDHIDFDGDDEDDEDREETMDTIIEEGKKIDQQMKLDKNTIKIKIVVVEVANSKLKKDVRRLISPIMSKLDLFPEFGMFHSALMIGPWFIDWNNSSMCIPRKCVCKAALLSADIDAIQSTEKIESIVDKLADVIVYWNTHMKYKDNNGRKGEEGNCQDFVDAILEALDLNYEFTGPLGNFLKKLRTKGTCAMQFSMSDEFRKKFEITEKKVRFETHKQLDLFVKHLIDVEPEFDTMYKPEWSMLKSFDRAFWLRHYKFDSDMRWQPHHQIEVDDEGDTVLELDCPYNDPRETYSFRFIVN